MVFFLSGFTKADDMALYKWATLPVFIGQLISAYEGIGCVSICFDPVSSRDICNC